MSATASQLSNTFITINNLKDTTIYEKEGLSAFVFALKDYSIGYPNTFSISEINNYLGQKYVLINRLLTNDDVDNLKRILPSLQVTGIIFEDIALINILNNLHLSWQKILFQNHFNCNYASIKCWLKYVDYVFISNELTIEEIKEIATNCPGKAIAHIFGLNQIMYSRRLLLTNFNQEFNLNNPLFSTITDKVSKIEFILSESPYGTICYNKTIYNGQELFNVPNLHYFINTSFIKDQDIISFIKGKELSIPTNDGFLHQKTIYKVGE